MASRKHRHSLSGGLVRTFKKFVETVRTKGVNEVHLQTEIDLTHNEYNNFQKLRYFGLVYYADKENRKSGKWIVTKLGGMFIRREIAIVDWVMTEDNHIVEKSVSKRFIDEHFGGAYDIDYWQREFGFTSSTQQGKLL